MSKLADAGIAVFTYDVHGHGKSEPLEDNQRCLIAKFDDLLDDLFTFMSVVEARTGKPIAPCFIGGQSMGGLVVAHAVLRDQERWAGLILHSAAIDASWTPVLRVQAAVGNLLAWAVPGARIVPAVRPEKLHPDPRVVEAFLEDPLIFHGDLRARTANEILGGFRRMQGREGAITLPVYAAHGTKDCVTSYEAVSRFTKLVSSPDVTFRSIEDGYHELLMGEEREGNAENIISWVKAHALGGKADAATASARL